MKSTRNVRLSVSAKKRAGELDPARKTVLPSVFATALGSRTNLLGGYVQILMMLRCSDVQMFRCYTTLNEYICSWDIR